MASKEGEELKKALLEEQDKEEYIIKRANEILDNGDPVKLLYDTHQSFHMGDPILSLTRIAAVGNQSATNTKGIQPASDGESGKGKSDGDRKFVHLLPPEYVVSGSVSDKVLYYKEDLKAGSYIFSDDVTLTDDLTSTIKRASSNFQQETPHHTLDKNRNVMTNNLPPRLVWALNSVEASASLQLINRQFSCSVDESPEQDERVLSYQKMCGMLGQEELPITENVLICREIVRELKKQLFKVIIPYSYLIEWRDSGNRRNFDMFEDMIRGFAVYFYRQRERDGNIIFADLSDFDRAVQLYTKRTEQQGRKLTDAELKIIKTIYEVGVADIKTLMDKTKLSQGRISQLINGKGKDNDSGLLHKVKGLHCEHELVRTPTGGTNKAYYTLSNFNPESYNKPVVWIDEIAKEEFSRYYHDITTLLLSKIKDSNHVITSITFINNIHKNKVYRDMLESVLLCTFPKIGNNGNNVATDAERKGNNVGNNVGNSASLLPQSTELPKITSQELIVSKIKEKFDKKSNIKKDNIITELLTCKELDDISDNIIDKVVDDYIQVRGG